MERRYTDLPDFYISPTAILQYGKPYCVGYPLALGVRRERRGLPAGCGGGRRPDCVCSIQ